MTSIEILLALCPSCPPAVAARALVFSETFWTNVTWTLLPFTVVGFVVHRIVTRLDRRIP